MSSGIDKEFKFLFENRVNHYPELQGDFITLPINSDRIELHLVFPLT